VMELTRTIWDGHDYVPQVWQKWLADPVGLLAVAELGGRVVGLVKVTRLSAIEWWLEGLRVHPDYERRGIASHLHDYAMDFWQRQGGDVIRLATASFRLAVHRLCERTGFIKVGDYTVYAADAVPGSTSGFTRLQPGEEGLALAFALEGEWRSLPVGLIDVDWQWKAPGPEQVARAIGEGLAWWWGAENAPRSLLLGRVGEDDEAGKALIISLLACPDEHLTACLGDFRCLAAERGQPRAAWFAPVDPVLEPALLAAGYHRDWKDSLFVFEKINPKGL